MIRFLNGNAALMAKRVKAASNFMDSQQVANILEKIGNGEISPVKNHPDGEICYTVVDYTVEDCIVSVYYDIGEPKYIDSILKDGQLSTYDDWDAEGCQPMDLLASQNKALYEKMKLAFKAVNLPTL